MGVLHYVVQESGGDGARVQTEFGKDSGDFEGVGEVGLSGDTLLPFVRLGSKDVCPHERLYVRLWVVLLNPIQDAFDSHTQPLPLRRSNGSLTRRFSDHQGEITH